MSKVLIQHYLAELSKLRQVSGSQRESVVREAFKDLLKAWGRAQDLIFVPEYEIESPAKERRYVDGALLYGLRLPFGYWEAKDARDDLDAEIEYKFSRGYPTDNIVFEDSTQAVLIQNRREVLRCAVDDVEKLQRLLELFFAYERPEIAEFRKAVEQFKADLPAVCDALRGMIEKAYADNAKFHAAADKFLKQAHESINPALTEADVREILIQHILTEEIFALVFPGTSYHEDNNIARELYRLEHTFFTGNTKHQTLRALEPYYAAIRRSAGAIASHHEKQTFLKVVYENFYKVYNPKAADRLGVVYTPNEIVRFMIESADWLCEQHFDRNLIDRDVEILDPAAGTGTFICELLEHFRGQPGKLKHKYLEELHANEVAILPYYVANLNIEATYAAISGEYLEYPNLCFVDTLDNVAGTAPLHRPARRRPVRTGRGEHRAHQAPEPQKDFRGDRQSAVQREPGQRERQQQESRIPGYRRAHQGHLYQGLHRAEDQALRHVRALLPLGQRPHRREWRGRLYEQLAATSTARTFDGFRACSRKSSTKSTSWISAATCAPIGERRRHEAQCVRHPDRVAIAAFW